MPQGQPQQSVNHRAKYWVGIVCQRFNGLGQLEFRGARMQRCVQRGLTHRHRRTREAVHQQSHDQDDLFRIEPKVDQPRSFYDGFGVGA